MVSCCVFSCESAKTVLTIKAILSDVSYRAYSTSKRITYWDPHDHPVYRIRACDLETFPTPTRCCDPMRKHLHVLEGGCVLIVGDPSGCSVPEVEFGSAQASL